MRTITQNLSDVLKYGTLHTLQTENNQKHIKLKNYITQLIFLKHAITHGVCDDTCLYFFDGH
jgi:hypothetical protein